MGDSLTRFGLSRRPASELFGEAPRPKRSFAFDMLGTPDVSGPGWGMAARRGVEEHQAALDEEAAIAEERASLEDQRIAREREREAEAAADEFTRIKEPSAREKFFDENEATMVGSRRYNALAEMRQRQPSFADNVLAKNLANKIDDPDERNVFLGAVAKGAGTLAAREEADRFRIRRQQAGRLGEAGYSPDEVDEILAKGVDDARVNYHIAQRKEGSMFPKDPQAQALEKRYRILKDKAAIEDKNMGVTPETEAELLRVFNLLDGKYKAIAEPPAAAAPIVPVGTGTVLRPKAGAATPPQGFKEVMAAGAPQAAPPPSELPAEEAPVTDKPEPFPESAAPPHVSLDNLGKKDLSDEDFSAAVGRFREYASAPTGMETYSQWMLRQKDVESKIKDAEGMRAEQKVVRQEVLPAWDTAKKDMESRVAAFSKKVNIPERVIYNTIAAGQSLTENDDPRSQASDPSSIFTSILGTDVEKRNPHLEKPVRKWDNQTFQAKPVQAFYRGLFGEFDVPTNSKVLQALAQEKAMGAPRTAAVVAPELPKVSTPEEAAKLSPGTQFVTPDGKVRIVPTK